MTEIEQILELARRIGWSVAGMHEDDNGGMTGLIMGEQEFVQNVLHDLDVDLIMKLDS